MAVKNVNVFEQHVEKIVLAVAVAGAAFMGYLAMQPVTVPETEVGPNDVEAAVTAEREKMFAAMSNLPNPEPKVTPYGDQYVKSASQSPLDSSLTAPPKFSFAPRNLAVGAGGGQVVDVGENNNWQAITPDPVAPEQVRAEAVQYQIAVNQTPPAQPLAAGTTLNTQTLNAVVIDGYIPVGKMLKQMAAANTRNRETLPTDLQRGLVYRVQVERREIVGSKGSDWKPVTPTKAAATPTDIPWQALPADGLKTAMDTADTEFKQIVIPDFYLDATGTPIQPPILTRPVPPSIDKETRDLHTDIENARAQAQNLRVGGGIMGGPAVPGAVATPTTFPSDAAQLKALEVVPFTFWDDTVQPNHKYQYAVTIQLVNPTFQAPFGLKDPKKKDVPLLTTGRTLIPNIVTVHSDMAFFIDGVDGGKVSGLIYKQNSGKWYRNLFSVPIGDTISGNVQIHDDIPPHTMEVDTGFAIVDATATGRNDLRVVLKDPSGNLEVRDAGDARSAERQDLEAKIQAQRAAATQAAATATAPGGIDLMAPTPPAPTRGGTTRPVAPPTTTRIRVAPQ